MLLQVKGIVRFARNEAKFAARKLPEADLLLPEFFDACNQMPSNGGLRVLEICYGDGFRLIWLKNTLKALRDSGWLAIVDFFAREQGVKNIATYLVLKSAK